MSQRKGLSLLETTIAIGVIVTGLFAAFTLVIANRRTSDEAGLRFAAIQLAREGVEVVRAIRDTNWLAQRTWDTGIAGSGAGSYTGVAVFTPATTSWQITFGASGFSDPNARVVRQQRNGNDETFWTQGLSSDAAATPYRRLIETHPICTDQSVGENGPSCDAAANPKVGMRVRSRVQWSSRGVTHEVAAEETMYDWR
jgi:Tfp pilus assembly protein PilV